MKPHIWKYKLGVFYSLFDGEKLLEASIRSIRDNVDYICVGYQEISYTGNRSETDLKPMLEDLKSRKLIDDYFLYETDLNKVTAVNETAKRQMGIEHALKNKCTHFFNIDTDEFFIFEQMKAAKQHLYENDVDVSFVYAVEYVKEPIYQCFKKYNLSDAFYF